MAMLWVKTFHIVFIASWFAGLFYLPRIFVNLAQQSDASVQATLLGMARRLYRFTTLLAVVAVAFGMWLYLGYRIGVGPGNGWMHAKLFVLLVIGYHHACGVMLRNSNRARTPVRTSSIAGSTKFPSCCFWRWWRWSSSNPSDFPSAFAHKPGSACPLMNRTVRARR